MRVDYQILFSALGFLTVLMKGESTQKDGAARATAMASVIELFCRSTRPDLFADSKSEQEIDEMIESLKKSFNARQLVGLASAPNVLYRLHERLQERQRDYATDDLVADEIAHLLEEEIKHAQEAQMMVVSVQGDADAFAPYKEIATQIVEILKTKGECIPVDLRCKGFAQDEIDQKFAMAYALARVELNWMDG